MLSTSALLNDVTTCIVSSLPIDGLATFACTSKHHVIAVKQELETRVEMFASGSSWNGLSTSNLERLLGPCVRPSLPVQKLQTIIAKVLRVVFTANAELLVIIEDFCRNKQLRAERDNHWNMGELSLEDVLIAIIGDLPIKSPLPVTSTKIAFGIWRFWLGMEPPAANSNMGSYHMYPIFIAQLVTSRSMLVIERSSNGWAELYSGCTHKVHTSYLCDFGDALEEVDESDPENVFMWLLGGQNHDQAITDCECTFAGVLAQSVAAISQELSSAHPTKSETEYLACSRHRGDEDSFWHFVVDNSAGSAYLIMEMLAEDDPQRSVTKLIIHFRPNRTYIRSFAIDSDMGTTRLLSLDKMQWADARLMYPSMLARG